MTDREAGGQLHNPADVKKPPLGMGEPTRVCATLLSQELWALGFSHIHSSKSHCMSHGPRFPLIVRGSEYQRVRLKVPNISTSCGGPRHCAQARVPTARRRHLPAAGRGGRDRGVSTQSTLVSSLCFVTLMFLGSGTHGSNYSRPGRSEAPARR
jgi:hypothetical protein